jgi:hypothetical protein
LTYDHLGDFSAQTLKIRPELIELFSDRFAVAHAVMLLGNAALEERRIQKSEY